MRISYLPVLLGFLFLISCEQVSKEDPPVPDGSPLEQLNYVSEASNYSDQSRRLNDFFQVYFDLTIEQNPVMATFMGIEGDMNGEMGDLSPEGVEKNLEEIKQVLDAAATFDPSTMNDQDRVNYELFMATLESTYELNSKYKEHYFGADQQFGNHLMLPTLVRMMPRGSTEDYEMIISRLKAMPAFLESHRQSLQEGLDAGITQPKITLVNVPSQLDNMISENVEESLFFMPFASLPENIGGDLPDRLREEARTVIAEDVNPALMEHKAFFEEVYIPGARESFGLFELPDGQAWYQQRIKDFTTTDMTAREIHDLGKSEVARIKAEMEKVKDEAGFEGDLNAFNDFLKTDPRFYFDTPEELLAAYRDICKRVDPKLIELFGTIPRLPYGVIPVPAFREKSATTAYYNPGSPDAGRPGYFYANTYDLKSRPSWEMEALSIHEAVPGHHFQIAIAQEMENVPEFRKVSLITAFVEGWGLYSESLGPELGMYQDPYSKYGQLTYEMWRAIRLVVDTGIHSLGWTRQDAIDYFQENSGKTGHDVTVEVDRYIGWPGQALAYKIGELKIKELRKRAEDALGDDFDIRSFHDEVLKDGAVPLDVLEAKIDRWIQEEQEHPSSL